jgi:hypothetical protein
VLTIVRRLFATIHAVSVPPQTGRFFRLGGLNTALGPPFYPTRCRAIKVILSLRNNVEDARNVSDFFFFMAHHFLIFGLFLFDFIQLHSVSILYSCAYAAKCTPLDFTVAIIEVLLLSRHS